MYKNKTIELVDLSIGYKDSKSVKVVAKHLNASIYAGELTCILGANGVGKSTLLRTLTLHQKKLGGNILFNGNSIDQYSQKDLATLVSVVLTEKIDIKNMTVHNLVSLGRAPYTNFWGAISEQDQSIINESIRLVKIENLANRFINTLSDGERQKAMIAKALAQQTPVILLDEPTAFLDFPSKVEMMQLLHSLSRKTGKTIFLSTHDLDLALQIADKIWLMDEQKSIKTGVPEDLSLNGILSDFFERKGICFCKETGLFRVENSTRDWVSIYGGGNISMMVKKALLRYGIKGIDVADMSEAKIIIEDKIQMRDSDNNLREIKDIETLLNNLVL